VIVIDATVAIKLLTREPGADAALARIIDEPERIAPDWIRIEIANALARKVRRHGLTEDAARAGLAGIETVITREVPTRSLLDQAFDLSIKLSHAMYDCLYLALAEREQGVLVTHDVNFAMAVRRAGLAERVELLT
jgi:predicted nucleic acid-binding protein